MNGRHRAMLRLAILPAIIAIAILLAWQAGYFELDRRQELYERVQRLRVLDGVEVGFIAAYVLAVALCLPTTIMIILGGAVFGFLYGGLFSFVGAHIGTMVAYVVSRTFARRPVARIFGDHRVFRQLRDHDGVLALFRLRILPVAPFGVLPYVSGIANVSLKRLLLATIGGSLPSIIAYSWLGNEALKAAVSHGEASRRALWIAAGVTLGMLALSVIPALMRRWRR